MTTATTNHRQTELDHLREQLRQTECERDVALQRVADVEALLTDPKTAVGKILERVDNIALDVDDVANDASYNCIPRSKIIETLENIAQELRAITEA